MLPLIRYTDGNIYILEICGYFMGIKKKQKIQMRDYLVTNLEGSNSIVDPRRAELVSGIDTHYIDVGEDRVLLVDNIYPNNSLNVVYKFLKSGGRKVIPVFYKDGETFFRNASRHFYKSGDGKELSLKKYSAKDMRKIILFRPEEVFVNSIREYVQYYQPASERLNEGIETFRFQPVSLDYSHVENDRFQPQNTDSRKLGLWVDRKHREGKLEIYKDYLIGKRN